MFRKVAPTVTRHQDAVTMEKLQLLATLVKMAKRRRISLLRRSWSSAKASVYYYEVFAGKQVLWPEGIHSSIVRSWTERGWILLEKEPEWNNKTSRQFLTLTPTGECLVESLMETPGWRSSSPTSSTGPSSEPPTDPTVPAE